MHRQPKWGNRTLCLLAALCLGATALASEPGWVEVRSPHFSVVTDAGEKRGRQVALRFEQMRAAFATLLNHGKVTLPVPLQIVAFRNTKEMRAYVPRWNGKPVEVAGLYQGGEDRSFILLDLSSEEPWHVVFHEYAHQLMDGNIAVALDPWFEEGFAEYFSSIETDDKEIRVGKIPEEEYRILERNGMMKMAEILGVRRDSKTYNESGDHRSVFYAQSGMFMHYLYDNQLVHNAGVYQDLVRSGVPLEEAVQRAFGMSPQQLDKALWSYLRSGQYKYYPITGTPGIAVASFTVNPLTFADARAILADVLLHSADHRAEAVAAFEEVLKLEPNHAAALRGLGYAYLLRQDYPAAGEYFRRAAEHDSNDPRVLYYAALLRQRETGPRWTENRDELMAVQKSLEKCVAMDPEFADAHNLLALTHMWLGQSDEALKTMLKAVALNPRNEHYALNLAQMYVRNGQYDQAIALLEPLRRSADPGIAAMAEQTAASTKTVKIDTREVSRVHLDPEGSGPAPVTPPLQPAEAPATAPPGSGAAVKFLKGRLLKADCSAAPGALLTVTSGTRTLRLHVKDVNHVIVIGADTFSCAWKNQGIAVNYQPTGEAAGEVISVELP